MSQLSGEEIASIAVVAGNRAARARAQKRRMGGDAANHAVFEYGNGASAGARSPTFDWWLPRPSQLSQNAVRQYPVMLHNAGTAGIV